MENRPEYLMAWLGLKHGRDRGPYQHESAANRLPIPSLLRARNIWCWAPSWLRLMRASRPLSMRNPSSGRRARHGGAEDLDAALALQAGGPLDSRVRNNVFGRDTALYIYTSGTTGLPKAANISHMRMLFMMAASGALNGKATDRMYNVLPLYHSAGGVCALGPVLLAGGSMVMRANSRPAEFWDDCIRYKPTFFQYIGELCRYLLNAPPAPHERDHNLRIAIGNGLRPEIWPAFQERFAIPRIMEFYGATEGNVSMLNYDGQVGAVGRVPWYARAIRPPASCVSISSKRCRCAGRTASASNTAAAKRARPSARSTKDRAPALRRLHQEGGHREENPARRVREGRRLVSHRRSDAPRRARLFLFCRPHRRHVPLEGRERRHQRSVRSDLGVFRASRKPMSMAWRCPAWRASAGMAALVADGTLDLDALASQLDKNLPAYARPIFLRLRARLKSPAPSSCARSIWCKKASIRGQSRIRCMCAIPRPGVTPSSKRRFMTTSKVAA